MGRMGTPADIGNAVALLRSPDAGLITGQLIYADGGASLADTLLPLGFSQGRPEITWLTARKEPVTLRGCEPVCPQIVRPVKNPGVSRPLLSPEPPSQTSE